jgi:transcriptional regulator with XRE-family HTH domain
MPKISENFKKRSETDVIIGKRVRKLRTLRGYSQVAIAKEIGVTFQQFQKYECGINRLCVSRLIDICKFCKVPPSYFFESLDDDNVTDNEGNTLHDSAAQESFKHEDSYNKEVLSLVKAFQNIKNVSVRTKVLSLVKTISKSDFDDSDKA